MFRTYDSTGQEVFTLKNYLDQSSSIDTQALILGEWNLNISDNIDKVGNYRYRPGDSSDTYYQIQTTYDSSDTAQAYTNATYSHTIFNTGIDSNDTPNIFVSNDKKEEMLYSLNECLNRFRPRSGINKLRYFDGKYINTPNKEMFSQPRYYISSKNDKFKYWSSFRKESVNGTEKLRGIANKATGNFFYIDDAAPFVTYTNPIPANRIVIKMQTNSSKYKNNNYKIDNNTTLDDPFYENPNNVSQLTNQTTPISWKIQYLNNSNQWIDATIFSSGTTRTTGQRIIGSDGYVEIAYGITNVVAFSYTLLGEYNNLSALPLSGNVGDAYLVPDIIGGTSGTIYSWNGTDWTTNVFTPTYGWYVIEEGMSNNTSLITELVSPKVYGTPTNIYTANYREFQFIKGIRVVVDTMSKFNSTFDLIEMSPRIVADLSERTISYSVEKIASDIGNSGLPVGELSVSSGKIDIFDYDQAFNINNDLTLNGSTITGSILSNPGWDISSKNLQLKFYEIIKNVLQPGGSYSNYYIPVKTLYIDKFPQIKNQDRKASFDLRDLYFYFETVTAPPLFLKNVSLTYAVATLLDSIGFSNYTFKYTSDETDFTIPYFYIAPDTSVANVLAELAKSSQTTMFFDEFNNFVLMSKDYLMGKSRNSYMTFNGTEDFSQNEIIKNQPTSSTLANIISLDSENNLVYNGGKIVYNNKYLQKSYSTIQESSFLPKNQVFKYKPVLLWEVTAGNDLRPLNEEVNAQGGYSLAAVTLNTELTNELPYVDSTGNIQNNIIDFGQSVYWLTKYNGYFYNNGEIIKYDAIEHALTNVVLTNLIGYLNGDGVTSNNTFKCDNINKLKIGQTIVQTNVQSSLFGNAATITAIDKDTNTITVSVNHSNVNTNNRAVEFSVISPETLVWITDTEDYQKYFAQLPFNGKLYPTGRVRIYTQPYYDTNGNIDKTKGYSDVINGTVINFTGAVLSARGAVAKHGRIQFGTGLLNSDLKTNMPVKHSILNENDTTNSWFNDSYKKVFKMKSDWIFKNNHQYVATSYTVTNTSNSQTVYAPNGTIGNVTSSGGAYYAPITGLGTYGNNFTIGQQITATNGTGGFGSGTVTVNAIYGADSIQIKSTANISGGNKTVTNISGSSNTTGSKIININENITNLVKDLIYSSGSSSIAVGTKIAAVKTFKVSGTQYNQIVLDKALTGNLGTETIVFIDKQLETLSIAKINPVPITGQNPRVSSTTVDLFDASYYNESTYTDNNSKVRPSGSIKSSALKISGSLNFYNSADVTNYNNGVYTANNTFNVGDTVSIYKEATSLSLTPSDSINGTYNITAVTPTTFTTNNTSLLNLSTTATAEVYSEKPADYISYVYKEYSQPTPSYFGTRIRIIGELQKKSKTTNEIIQKPIGSSVFDTINVSDYKYDITGTGGGIAINLDVNQKSHVGYYFEIDALTTLNINDTVAGTSSSIPNVYFYKVLKGSSNDGVPVVLWYGNANILCDDGTFIGSSKLIEQTNTSVYDLAIEQLPDNSTKTQTFNLYINNKLVATVVDTDAIPTGTGTGYNYNNAALFVRGGGQLMFENFFMISKNNNQNNKSKESTYLAFNDQKFDNSLFRKYMINPFVVSTYLQGIGSNNPNPEYTMYYEEFGSIFRECAYFNVRYDKAYPALYSKISPTFNDNQGYVVSGYNATAYNAEFLIFNVTDFALNLDNTTGNYLRIQGISFTQQSQHDLTVDEYFTKNSNFNNYNDFNKNYINIQNSRNLYGNNEFTIQGEYIQSKGTAEGIMDWIVNKIMKPKKSVGLKIFANPILQLGDIVTINYAQDGVNIINPNSKFVIYHMNIDRGVDGPQTTIYLSEVSDGS